MNLFSSFNRLDDDDAPYSPGGSEDGDAVMDTVPLVAPAAPTIVPSELQLEVERLNRQIEAQKNEIVEMLAKDPLVRVIVYILLIKINFIVIK